MKPNFWDNCCRAPVVSFPVLENLVCHSFDARIIYMFNSGERPQEHKAFSNMKQWCAVNTYCGLFEITGSYASVQSFNID